MRRAAVLVLALLAGAAVASAQPGSATRSVTIRIPAVPAPEIHCGDLAMYADVAATVARTSGRLRAGTAFTAHVLNCDAIAAGCYDVSLTTDDVSAILASHIAPVSSDGLTLRPGTCP